jgi:hypothetical protein
MILSAAALWALLLGPSLAPWPDTGEWITLFDGQTTAGWRGYRQERFPEGWAIRDGCLTIEAPGQPGGSRAGDLITTEEFSDFELEFEWKIPAGGNSGVKYLVSEDTPKAVSFEYQMIDDDAYRDKMTEKQACGALYDLLGPSRAAARPVGEFNQGRIVVRGDHLEHWLNGIQVIEMDRGSALFHDLVAKSKFRGNPNFGQARRGHILLQEHRNPAWFRNIRIRPIHAS